MASRFFREDHIIHRRHRALNTAHTWLLVSGSLGLLAVTAWAIAGVTGLIYALIFGFVSMLAARRLSPQMVLRMYKAKPVDANNWPVGHQLIAELSKRANLPVEPKLYVVPSKMMNAFAVGRLDDSAIAVTDSLATQLTTRELAGVLAHEVTHIRNEDIKVMSLADMVSRFTSTLSTVGIFAVLFNLSGFFQISWIGILAMIAAPTVGGMLQMALSRTREFDADYGAVLLTGDPDGLSSALGKLEQAYKRRLEGMMFPTSRMPEASLLRSHPPTEERVARLNQFKETLVALADEEEVPAAPHVPETSAKPKPAASSPVPKVKPRFGRAAADAARHERWSAFAGEVGVPEPIVSGEDGECPSCDKSLNPPERHGAKPRIRIRSGGVWW